MDKGMSVITGRIVAACLTLGLIALIAALPACSDEPNQVETVVSEVNTLDRPEIVEVLFHPTKTGRVPAPEGAVDIDVTVAEGVSLGCRLFTSSPAAPTLIFFHGNGETVPDYDDIGPFYVREGMNFLVTDYRGYGWSTGRPLTSTLLADSRAVFLQLKDWLAANGYTGALFVMGRSLGSACAIEVAVEHSEAVTGLIIESGFAETLPLGRTLGIDLERLGITEEMTFANASQDRAVHQADLHPPRPARPADPPVAGRDPGRAQRRQEQGVPGGARRGPQHPHRRGRPALFPGHLRVRAEVGRHRAGLARTPPAVQGAAGRPVGQLSGATMVSKRTGYLSWDEYFMAVALLSGQRSKDPNTQVGACVANDQNKIVGVGYNGFPWGCSDDVLPWAREGDWLDTKYPYVCHAELNAVLNSITFDLRRCRIYVALFPCNECTKVIIQAGISEIIYLSDKYKDTDSVRAAKIMLEKSQTAFRQFFPSRDSVLIDFRSV